MSQSVALILHKAQRHAKKGETDLAVQQYKRILQKYPQNKRAIAGLKALQRPERIKKAANPQVSQEQFNGLITLYNQGKLKQALDAGEALEKQFPSTPYIPNLLGAVNAGLGRLEQAVANFEKALAIKPDYAEAYNNMGSALKDKGESDAAIESYKKALKIKPDYAEAYNNMGNALLDKGEPDPAIESYKMALKIKPDYAGAYNNMGNALKDKGEPDPAIESFKKALKIKPDYAEAYNNMGNALLDKGDPEAAIESYKMAIKIKPDHADAYNNMGAALKDKEESGAAIESYKKALEIKPDYAGPKHLIAALTGSTTDSAPRAYVESLFDDYACKFDNSLVGKLDYKIPKTLAQIILANTTGHSLGSILDLGCGTGLAGVELKGSSQNLEGIDLSSSMLEEARKKNAYDRLIHTDLIEYLSTADLDFDYFVSTDVFIYVGELSDVFRLIKSRNKCAGKLAFSTEHTEKEGFFLETSGRYSHSKRYIEELCEKFEYRILHFSTTNLRKEKNGYLTGGLYLLDFAPKL